VFGGARRADRCRNPRRALSAVQRTRPAAHYRAKAICDALGPRAMGGEPDDDLPKLNTGEPWSKEAIRDLRKCIALGDGVDEIANFLCRTRREVREKARELGLKIYGE